MFKNIVIILGLFVLAVVGPVSGYGQIGRKSVPATEVNGTFRMNFTGKFRGSSNEIKILALGGGRLRVAMELLYPYIVKGELSAKISANSTAKRRSREIPQSIRRPSSVGAQSPSNL